MVWCEACTLTESVCQCSWVTHSRDKVEKSFILNRLKCSWKRPHARRFTWIVALCWFPAHLFVWNLGLRIHCHCCSITRLWCFCCEDVGVTFDCFFPPLHILIYSHWHRFTVKAACFWLVECLWLCRWPQWVHLCDWLTCCNQLVGAVTTGGCGGSPSACLLFLTSMWCVANQCSGTITIFHSGTP